jgi:hypothetical protein
MLEHEPMLDPLRNDARYRGLVARMPAELDMRRQIGWEPAP